MSTNDVATQSLQASFGDTSSNAVCTELIQVQSLKAKSNYHYQIEPACRAVGQQSQPNQAFCVGARRCGRAAHRLARSKQPRKATKMLLTINATASWNRPTLTPVPSRATQNAPQMSQEPRSALGSPRATPRRPPVVAQCVLGRQ